MVCSSFCFLHHKKGVLIIVSLSLSKTEDKYGCILLPQDIALGQTLVEMFPMNNSCHYTNPVSDRHSQITSGSSWFFQSCYSITVASLQLSPSFLLPLCLMHSPSLCKADRRCCLLRSITVLQCQNGACRISSTGELSLSVFQVRQRSILNYLHHNCILLPTERK